MQSLNRTFFEVASASAVIIVLGLVIFASGGVAHSATAQIQGPPQPVVTIDTPADLHATNVNTIFVQVSFAAVNGNKGSSNIMDVDLLLNGGIYQTIPHIPPVHEGTEVFEVDISGLPDGVIELVAHAYQGNRLAGLVGISGVVRVVVDRTAPEIVLIWPPNEMFGTDLGSTEIEGTTTDTLSGVESMTLVNAVGVEDLTHPDFATVQMLDTEVSAADPVAENFFTLVARDAAGNEGRLGLQVNFTLQATIIPLEAMDLVEREGLFLAKQLAFIVFHDGVQSDERHATVQQFGGRVAGYLDAFNTVLAAFTDCESVDELIDILIAVEAEANVKAVQLDYLLLPTAALPSSLISWGAPDLDNDALGTAPGQPAVVYGNVLASEATMWIDSNVPAAEIRPVTVAVMDTGLDPSEGTNDEFAGINFVDGFDTPMRGIWPLPFSAPTDLESRHGTNVTGVVAGRNNGFGNNGVATILNGSQVEVIVYGLGFSDSGEESVDPHALACAANDIALRGVDVVNLSFGVELPPFVLAFSGVGRGFWQEILSSTPNTFWVAAAGNDAIEMNCDEDCAVFCNIEVPAVLSCEFANMISVAAHWPESVAGNGEEDELLEFSNYDLDNAAVQISAPGVFVLTAPGNGDLEQYGYFNGTSAAAPMVTGAAALMMSVSDIPAGDARSILVATGRTAPASNPHVALDVSAAVQQSVALSAPPCLVFGADGGGSDSASPTDFSCVWPTAPALNSFDFNFDDDDHHIDRIQMALSPAGVDVAYDDHNDDDDYTWAIEGMTLPLATTYGSVAGSSGGGCALSEPLVGNGVFVLTGFELNYADDDHHIDRIFIEFREQAGETRAFVCYHDTNLDDDFTYQIDYAVIPAANVLDVGSTTTQFDGGGVDTLILGFSGLGVPVIRGFSFDFSDDDHHIDRISIDISMLGSFTVAYHDQNLDDDYEWSVDYAIIVP